MATLKRCTRAAQAALAKEGLRARQEEQLWLVLFILLAISEKVFSSRYSLIINLNTPGTHVKVHQVEM